MAVLVVRQTHLAVSVGGLRFAASPKISAERKYPRGENIRLERVSVRRKSERSWQLVSRQELVHGDLQVFHSCLLYQDKTSVTRRQPKSEKER